MKNESFWILYCSFLMLRSLIHLALMQCILASKLNGRPFSAFWKEWDWNVNPSLVKWIKTLVTISKIDGWIRYIYNCWTMERLKLVVFPLPSCVRVLLLFCFDISNSASLMIFPWNLFTFWILPSSIWLNETVTL